MIDIKVTALPKKVSNVITTGIYGSAANTPTAYNNAVTGDEINASVINTINLTVSGTGTINSLNSGNIRTNSLSTNTANIDRLINTYLNSSYIDADNISVKDMISDNISVKDLTVTGSAHFFELVIDEIRAAGGQYILSAAQPFVVADIEEYANEVVIYFPASDGTKQIRNTWATNDLLIHRSFNQVEVGNNSNVSNKFYWLPVTGVSSEPKEYNGKMLHFVKVSKTKIMGIGNWTDIEIGDNISQLGNLNNTNRQNAIYIAAGETSLDAEIAPPLIAQYAGIKTCDLSPYRTTFLSRGQNTFVGNLKVSSGTSVEDYIDDKIDEINTEGLRGKDGESAYTVVYSNQIINKATDYEGNITDNLTYTNSTEIQLYYGNKLIPYTDIVNFPTYLNPNGINTGTPANITADTNAYKYIFSFDNSYLNSWNDNNVFNIPFLLNNNKTVTANIYVNKIRAGENGVTSPVYELVSTTDFVKYNQSGTKSYPIDSKVSFSVSKIYDNKYTTLTALPSGFYINYERQQENGVNSYYGTSYYAKVDIPISYKDNSYYNVNYSATLYDNNNTVIDKISVPVLFDGKNGTNGSNGTNGKDGQDAIYDRITFSELSAVVNLEGQLRFKCSGEINRIVGNTVTTYDYNNCTLTFAPNDSTYSSNITISDSGKFSYDNCLTYDYITALKQGTAGNYYTVTLYNPQNAVLDKATVNVTTEVGATFEVNTELGYVNSRVQSAQGEISSLKQTATKLQSDMVDISNSAQQNYSTLTQRADKIETKVNSFSVGGKNIIDRTEFETIDIMTTNTEYSNEYDFHYRDVSNGTITVSNKLTQEDSNVLIINAINGTGKSGGANYIDVMQQLTGKLKPSTDYVLHYKYRVDFNSNTLNTNGIPAAIYITNTNATWREIDGVEQTSLPSDLYTPMTDTNGAWKDRIIRFKTGTLGATNTLFIRCFIGSKIELYNLKLEEGYLPTSWNLSNNDRTSMIAQTADSITLEVKDELSRTGIDIDNGKITLDADNTIIDGDLNITNSNTGLTIIDDGKVAVQIKKQQIGNSDDFSLANQYYLPMSTDASLLNKTYAINTPYDIYTSKYDLGNYNAGEQISITELYLQTYKNGSVNALPIKQYNQSFYVKFYCNGVLKKTITSSVSATLDEYDDYTFKLPDVNYTVETGGIYTVQIGFSGTSPSSLNLYYPYNKNPFTAIFSMYVLVGRFSSKITTIGVDGLYSSTGDNRVFWIGTDKMMLKWFNINNSNENKVYGIEIGDNGIMQICGNKVDDTNVVRKTVLGGYEYTKSLYTKEYADAYYYNADDYCIAKVTAMSNYLAANNTGNYYLYQMTDNDYVIDSCVYNEQTGRVYIVLPAYDFTEYIIGRLVKIYNIGTATAYVIGANGIDVNKNQSDTKYTGHTNLYKRGTYDKVKQVALSAGQSADFVFKNGYWEYIKYS